MGGTASCPVGFESGILSTCRISCPDDFRFLNTDGENKCVYRYDNSKTISLSSLPPPDDINEPGSSYQDELDRFNTAVTELRNQIRIEEETKQVLTDAQTKKTQWASEYSSIKSQQASYNSAMDVKKVLDETEQSLRPLRADVAPSEDLEKERRAITIDARQNMVLAQFSLFLVVLSLIAYITLSREMAHGITFLLLCVGIATGFFLRR